MQLKFSCFISYPHSQKKVLAPYLENLVDGLEREILSQTDMTVFVDKDLGAGTRLDREIGANLCQSACMILFYTPLYFATEHIYCARELLAMKGLEEQRMNFLPDKNRGLIIPIVIRGAERFPLALKNELLYEDFTGIEFNDPAVMLRVRYSKEIRKVAQYIINRCEQLAEVPDDHLPRNCESFCLPHPDEARQFVKRVLGKEIVDNPVSSPFRTGDETNGWAQSGG